MFVHDLLLLKGDEIQGVKKGEKRVAVKIWASNPMRSRTVPKLDRDVDVEHRQTVEGVRKRSSDPRDRVA